MTLSIAELEEVYRQHGQEGLIRYLFGCFHFHPDRSLEREDFEIAFRVGLEALRAGDQGDQFAYTVALGFFDALFYCTVNGYFRIDDSQTLGGLLSRVVAAQRDSQFGWYGFNNQDSSPLKRGPNLPFLLFLRPLHSATRYMLPNKFEVPSVFRLPREWH